MAFYIPKRALVIAAHCDDIEFGVSGTVARWTDGGAQVTYVIVTDGRAGSNAPDADLDALAETRIAEQMASAAIVGVQDVRFLGYADGTLEPTLALRKDLTRIIRDVRPEVVITFDPETIIAADMGYINHPDHRAVAMAALYAVFPSAGTRPIFPELLDEGYEPHDINYLYLQLTSAPSLHIDISPVIERKLEALRCHASQLNEEVVGMVRKWDGEAGKPFGVDYAEAFRVITLREPAAPST